MSGLHRSASSIHPSRTLLAIALAAPLVALAQQPSGSGEAQTLDAINVTAQRKVENIREVPVAITALSGEPLEVLVSGGGDIRILAGRVPSLNVESGYGRSFPRFYIRGLGNIDFDFNASQPVSLIYDDVVQENPLLKGFPVFDLEQLEVLRGPQGTLFGRNTPAGVVKFDSARPRQEFGGYGRVSYGSEDMLNVETAVGGALSPRWSARVSALYQHRSDDIRNIYPDAIDRSYGGHEEWAARVQFLYEGDAFEGLFNLHRREVDGNARIFYANAIEPGTNRLVPGFNRKQVEYDGANRPFFLNTWGGSARLRWDFGDYRLHSITGYESAEALSHGDVDGGWGAAFLPGGSGPGVIPFPSESADGLPDHKQITQELRLESDLGGRFDWQAGLFWFKEDLGIETFSYDSLAPGNPQNGHAAQTQVNKAWAVFVSGEYAASERLKLRGGLRYTQDKKDFSGRVLQSAPGGTPVGGPFVEHTDVDDLSWDASAVFELNPETNLYARVARGFRAPSIQGRLAFGGVTKADSETVLSFETGIKADLFDRRARLGFNLFHYRVDDQQMSAIGGNVNSIILINAERSVGQGFELDLQAYLADNLLVTLGSSYNKTEIRDRTLAVPRCGNGCTVTNPPVLDAGGNPTGDVLIGGNPLTQAPRWIHNLTARWSLPLDQGNEFFVYTDWAYRSEVLIFPYRSLEYTGRALLEGGLRIGYQWGNGDYELALFGRNITDTMRVVGGIDFNNLTGFLNEPRTVGVELIARF